MHERWSSDLMRAFLILSSATHPAPDVWDHVFHKEKKTWEMTLMILSMVGCGHYKGHERTGQTAEQTLGAHSDTQERKSTGATCTVIPATDAYAALHSCFLKQAQGYPSRPTVKFSKAAILKVSVRGWGRSLVGKGACHQPDSLYSIWGTQSWRTHSTSCFLTSLHLNEHV